MSSPKVIHLFSDEQKSSSDTSQDIFEIDTSFELQPTASVESTTKKLDSMGILYNLHGRYHIKVQHVSFWPTSGTVMLDGSPKFKQTGFDFFIKVLQRECIIK